MTLAQNYLLVRNIRYIVTGFTPEYNETMNRLLLYINNTKGRPHSRIGFTLTKQMATELIEALQAEVDKISDDDPNPRFQLVKGWDGDYQWVNPGLVELIKRTTVNDLPEGFDHTRTGRARDLRESKKQDEQD